MPTRSKYSLPLKPPRGMTLVELLIVCFIIVLFVAVAAPLMRPNTNDRKAREAARQLNAYFAQAKAYAAQRGKSVALVFDRSAVEGAQSTDIVTRLYLAEAPPTYAGDTISSTVALWTDPTQAPIPGFTPAAVNGFNPILLVLDFAPGNPMVDVITASYWANPQPNDKVPFTIRLGNRGAPTTSGPWYQGIAIYQPSVAPTGIPGRNIQYFIVAQYNQPWAKLPPPVMPSPYPSPPFPANAVFQMNFPPQNSSTSTLELPTGTCVDLLFSGYQYYDYDPAVAAAQAEPGWATFSSVGTSPLYIVFGPGGDVQYVLGSGGINYQPTRMNFLVGTTDRAIEGAGDATLRTTNLNDRSCQWVTVNARTGYISTADNAGFDQDPPNASTMPVPPADGRYMGTAIGRARAMAAALNTKGGR